MCNCCISSPSANLTTLARVAKASANWLCARGKCDTPELWDQTADTFLSRVLIFFFLWWRILPLTFPLISSHLLLMSIRILWPVISSSFLPLSHESFSTSPFLFLSPLFSLSWVPSTLALSGEVRLSFSRSGHVWRRSILQLLLLHLLPLLPLPRLVV